MRGLPFICRTVLYGALEILEARLNALTKKGAERFQVLNEATWLLVDRLHCVDVDDYCQQ